MKMRMFMLRSAFIQSVVVQSAVVPSVAGLFGLFGLQELSLGDSLSLKIAPAAPATALAAPELTCYVRLGAGGAEIAEAAGLDIDEITGSTFFAVEVPSNAQVIDVLKIFLETAPKRDTKAPALGESPKTAPKREAPKAPALGESPNHSQGLHDILQEEKSKLWKRILRGRSDQGLSLHFAGKPLPNNAFLSDEGVANESVVDLEGLAKESMLASLQQIVHDRSEIIPPLPNNALVSEEGFGSLVANESVVDQESMLASLQQIIRERESRVSCYRIMISMEVPDFRNRVPLVMNIEDDDTVETAIRTFLQDLLIAEITDALDELLTDELLTHELYVPCSAKQILDYLGSHEQAAPGGHFELFFRSVPLSWDWSAAVGSGSKIYLRYIEKGLELPAISNGIYSGPFERPGPLLHRSNGPESKECCTIL